VDHPVHRPVRTTTSSRDDLTPRPPRARRRTKWNTTDSEVAGTAMPNHTINHSSQTRPRHQAHRWIEAKTAEFERAKWLMASLGLLLTFATTGCGESQDAGASPQLATTADPTPSAPPSTTPEPSPTIVSAAGMATETSALSLEEFNSLTQAKRLAFISYEYQGLTDGTSAGFFTGKLASGKYPFEVNPMEVANSDNTAQEIIDQHFFSLQAALCQRLDATGKDQTIDSVAASRLLSGVHYYVAARSGDEHLGYYTSSLLTQPGDEAFRMSDRYTAVEGTELTTGTDADGRTVRFKDISWLVGGESRLDRFAIVPFLDAWAKPHSIWLSMGTPPSR